MGIFGDLRKSCRNRENYREQLRKLAIDNAQKTQEIQRLRRKLAEVERYVREALA